MIIAFRFGDRNWQGWPLTADKFAHWLSESGDATNFNLFMDYETFGEHQWSDSGILIPASSARSLAGHRGPHLYDRERNYR